MNLELSPADCAFRDEVHGFLAANLTEDMRQAGAHNTATFCDVDVIARWHDILYRKGWVAPAWPLEYGGPGWSVIQRYIFASECAAACTPGTFSFGTLMCGPVIMRYGTDEQKAFYLNRILSGDDRWCQGYSEPGAGSDLASLQTRAVSDGDDYVVTGTKIWTTFAHHANRMFCLVRTNTSAKPQRGISFLLVDMQSPGISMSPIVNIAGDHEFNQVFLDGVRVPKRNRVGAENEGWSVAKYLLEFERSVDQAARLRVMIEHVKRLMHLCNADDASLRTKLAQAECEIRALEVMEHRTMSALSLGQSPGSAASLLKLRGSEMIQRLDELALEALGSYAAVYQPKALRAGYNGPIVGPTEGLVTTARYLYDRAVTIFGGTSEIQRDILARTLLRL
jgi:acyl-CoA dehydrogenase